MRGWLMLGIGLLIGTIAGAGGMLIAFPYLFPLPIVDDRPPSAEVVGRFKFDETAPGRDSVHWANGSGSVYRFGGKEVIRLDDDFEAGPGPNFWIYLNTTAVGDEATFLADAGRQKITPLKSFKRGQNYELPSGVKLSDFTTLTIWCESFSAYIASAKLPPAAR